MKGVTTEKSTMLSCPAQLELNSKKKSHYQNTECWIQDRKNLQICHSEIEFKSIFGKKNWCCVAVTKSLTTLGGESEILEGGKFPPNSPRISSDS